MTAPRDGAPHDTAPRDAAQPDTARRDAAQPDAAPPDIAVSDAGPPGAAPPDGAALARWAAGYAADVKAIDIIELDLREVLGYTDYFVICSGGTDRQTKAIHDRIHEGMKKQHGILPRRVEGLREARWILMDYLDVIVHVFTPDARDFYRLEQLWGEAPKRAVG